MNAVWQGAPCNARDVLERVAKETGWAYTTVRTLLQRLVDKGALAVHQQRNTSIYEPRIERRTAQTSAVRALLQKAFDGTFGGLLQHLVREEQLTARQRRELQRLLDDPAAARREQP